MHVINGAVVSYAIYFFFVVLMPQLMSPHVFFSNVNQGEYLLVVLSVSSDLSVHERNPSQQEKQVFPLKNHGKKTSMSSAIFNCYIYLSECVCLALERNSEATDNPGRINSLVCFSLRKSAAVHTDEFYLCFRVLLLWRGSAVSVPKL